MLSMFDTVGEEDLALVSHHVRLGGELVRLQTLQRHPFHRQLHAALVVDAVVFFVVNISGQAEVGHLHRVALIQPAGEQSALFLIPAIAMTTHVFCPAVSHSAASGSINKRWVRKARSSHAVSGSQVSVDKLLAGEVLHPSGHLQAEPHQVLHRRVLEETRTIRFYGLTVFCTYNLSCFSELRRGSWNPEFKIQDDVTRSVLRVNKLCSNCFCVTEV